MSPAPTSTADDEMTAGEGGVGVGVGSGVGVAAVATDDGAVGLVVNADPPQAPKITAQLIAAASVGHLGSMRRAELNMVVMLNARAFVRSFRARYDFSCL